jgi:hypothetical protein
LPAGSEVAGFRLGPVIGRGRRSVVYEATQIGLDRRVALKLLATDARLRRLEWPDHPHVVRLYAAGACEQGQFLAMQLVAGSTLADLHGSARVRDALTQVAAALDAAHAAGVVHGAIGARNVLVAADGRALVSDFGLGPAGATPESDLAAFAALVRERLGDAAPGPTAAAIVSAAPRARRRRRPATLLAVGGVVALAAVAAVLAASTGPRERALSPLRGAQALGSALPSTGVDSVDCDGRPPTGGSPQCTLVQTGLRRRPLGASRDGAIRRWAVRGARGNLALQVVRRRGRTFEAIARTPYVRIPDAGLHVLPANLAIRVGDLVGLQVAPGAAIGVRRGVTGAATARSFAPFTFTTQPVDHGEGTGFDYEVLLRVDYVPGARATAPGLLSGRAAERAPAGRELATRDVEPRPGQVRTAALVALGDRIAVDLLDGGRRLVRLPVADADARGVVQSFDTLGEPTVRLRWRNPDGRVVGHDYAVGSGSLTPSS